MKTKIIKKLWKGFASLRDKEVEGAISDGGIILKLQYTEQFMTLYPKDLENGKQLTRRPHKSKFNEGQEFYLIDFKWKPDRQDKNQTTLGL